MFDKDVFCSSLLMYGEELRNLQKKHDAEIKKTWDPMWKKISASLSDLVKEKWTHEDKSADDYINEKLKSNVTPPSHRSKREALSFSEFIRKNSINISDGYGASEFLKVIEKYMGVQ